jgi:hypothetical protein
MAWHSGDNIDYEEMRTILGSPSVQFCTTYFNPPAVYLEGDDLSENLFRLSLGLSMRFGHSYFAFFEDYQVVELALFTVYSTAVLYDLREKKFPPMYGKDHVWNAYTSNGVKSQGLGLCIHPLN